MVRIGAVGEMLVGVDVPLITGTLGSSIGVEGFAGLAKTALCSKAIDEITASVDR